MKRAALYLRVSIVDQHPETQILDLHQMDAQRGAINQMHHYLMPVPKGVEKPAS